MNKATKFLALATAASGLSLFAAGCETMGKTECEQCAEGQCTGEHAEGEHPTTGEHPSAEQPSNGEHPSSEHPG